LHDLRKLVSVFDEHPPRGRAGDVYSVWRELILLEPRTRECRRSIVDEIRRTRQFAPGLDAIAFSSCADRSRRRCAAALESWARSADFPGSATAYERWRRTIDPAAPTRNTIAAAFGSWASALTAVGLRAEASLDDPRVAAIRAGHEERRATRQAGSRALVLDAVRRCIGDLGREPRATEFLAWRREHARGCPSQMTIYRLFPGGFDEVVAIAQGRQGRVPVS